MRLMTTTAAIALATAMSLGAPAYAIVTGSNADAGGIIDQSSQVITYQGEAASGGTTLATTTKLFFTSGLVNITQIPTTYQPPGGSSAPNTFFIAGNALTVANHLPSIAGSLGVSPTTFPTGVFVPDNIPNFLKLTGSAGTYSFNATGMEVTLRSDAGNVGQISLDLLGTLHDGSGTYLDTGANFGLQLNQSGDGVSTISGGFTLTSPSAFIPNVPEPASLTLLGVGLIGLGAVRKRFAKR